MQAELQAELQPGLHGDQQLGAATALPPGVSAGGLLPEVRDVTLFEGAGLCVPTRSGDLVVRIDRAGVRPKFAVTLSDKKLVSLPEDNLSPLAAAELAAAAQPPAGSSARALLLGIGGLFLAFLVVTGGIVLLTRATKEDSSKSFPTLFANPQISLQPAPLLTSLPSGAANTVPLAGNSAIDEQTQEATRAYLWSTVSALGATSPNTTIDCMMALNTINAGDVLDMSAPYRSSLYQCMPDELSVQWRVTATGLLPADEPCARRANVVGLGRLSLAELELIGPTANTTQFPVDIQDKLVVVVKELCPQIPADVAERIIKE